MPLVDDRLLEGPLRVLDQLTMDITRNGNRAFVLAHRSELGVNRVREHLSSPCLLQQDCPGVLVLDEGSCSAVGAASLPCGKSRVSRSVMSPM
jgi:hypothetical protein